MTAGLFSHVDEREVPCKIDGCGQTWTWTAEEQIRAFGEPPPKRMCAEHVAQFHALTDLEVPCAASECTQSWVWTKAARIAQLQRSGSDEPPQRFCDACKKAGRQLGDADVPCRIDGCSGTWRWSREAQTKHRAWLKRSDEPSREASDEGRGARRRRRQRDGGEGPPAKLCERCREKLGTLIDREVQCKVHGCTRMVTVDRETQLRAWVMLRTDDVSVAPALPKRMCEVCREFCRLHADRQVSCGRPGCDRTWTYKTGAQLQAFLAGRLEDPVRLCGACSQQDAASRVETSAPEGVEVMPCIVPACAGVWYYRPGMSIAAADDGDLPLDRMCDPCRERNRATPRNAPDAQPGDAPAPHEASSETRESAAPAQAERAAGAAPADVSPAASKPRHGEVGTRQNSRGS